MTRQFTAYNSGDELVLPLYFCNPDGTPVNISNCTVLAEIWWRGAKRLELEVGDGITIFDTSPPEAGEGEDQEVHGELRLTEVQGALPPFGRVGYLKFIFIDSLHVTFSTEPLYLEKRLP